MISSLPDVCTHYFSNSVIGSLRRGCSQNLTVTTVTAQNYPVICNSKRLCCPEPKRFISATTRFDFCSHLLCPANQMSLPMPVWSGSSLYLLQLWSCSASPKLPRQQRSQHVAGSQIHRRRWADELWQVTHTADAVAHKRQTPPPTAEGEIHPQSRAGVESRRFLCHPTNWLSFAEPRGRLWGAQIQLRFYLLCGVALVLWRGKNRVFF